MAGVRNAVRSVQASYAAIDENKPHGSDFPWGLRLYSVLRFPLGLVLFPPSGEVGVFRGEGGFEIISN